MEENRPLNDDLVYRPTPSAVTEHSAISYDSKSYTRAYITKEVSHSEVLELLRIALSGTSIGYFKLAEEIVNESREQLKKQGFDL